MKILPDSLSNRLTSEDLLVSTPHSHTHPAPAPNGLYVTRVVYCRIVQCSKCMYALHSNFRDSSHIVLVFRPDIAVVVTWRKTSTYLLLLLVLLVVLFSE